MKKIKRHRITIDTYNMPSGSVYAHVSEFVYMEPLVKEVGGLPYWPWSFVKEHLLAVGCSGVNEMEREVYKYMLGIYLRYGHDNVIVVIRSYDWRDNPHD